MSESTPKPSPCRLLSLSSELQNLVLRHVAPFNSNRYFFTPRYSHPQYSNRDRRNYNEQKAVERRNLKDIMNLGATCSFYRNLLAPVVFGVVVLRNTEISAASITKITNSRYSKMVHTLHFIGAIDFENDLFETEGNRLGEIEDEPLVKISTILPPSVHRILSQLNGTNRLFPNLESVVLMFPDEWDDPTGWPYYDAETPEETVAAEARQPVRVLTNTVVNALAENSQHLDSGTRLSSVESGHFSKLRLRNLSPRNFSAFSFPAWHDLLNSSIKCFLLTISDCGMGMGPALWTDDACIPAWSETLGTNFFDHLNICEDFSVISNDEMPLGRESFENHCRLDLLKTKMPQLRSVTMSTIIICEELIEFFKNNAATLVKIMLIDCFAPVFQHEPALTRKRAWVALFEALLSNRPRNLVELCVAPDIEDVFGRSEKEDDLDLDELVDKVAKGRAFAYGHLDEREGNVYLDKGATLEHVEKGDDQRAWDLLQEVMNFNRRTRGKVTEEMLVDD